MTLILLAAPILDYGQTYNIDTTSIPEPNSLEPGKPSKKEWNGFTWHISTGYFSQVLDENSYYYPAAVLPYAIEFGYRMHFLEVGFRHFRTASGFGTDYPYGTGVGGGPNILESYRLPALTGLVANMGTARIHIPVKKVPVSFNFGAGNAVFRFSDNFISQVFYDDGSIKYVDNSGAIINSSLVKAFAYTFGLNISKGPFFCGVEWWYLRGEKDAFGSRYTNKMQNMHVGLQMNTSQNRKTTRTKNTAPLKRKRLALGISSLASIAPFQKYSGTGSGISVDASVNLGKRTAILGSFQVKSSLHGFNKIPGGHYYEEGGYNPAGQIGRHLVFAGTLLNPKNEFQVYAYYGGGYYFATQQQEVPIIDPFPIRPYITKTFKKSGGVVIGSGIQYKYLHSQVLLHNTFSSYPAILEWNLGGRILF